MVKEEYEEMLEMLQFQCDLLQSTDWGMFMKR